jgi:rare lipoprotein A
MKRRVTINSGAALILMVGLTGAAYASHHRAHSSHGSGGMSGLASVYSGGRTANGEHAGAGGLTAAHRSLPFGTLVKVTNRSSQRSVIVRINDRGPYVGGRVIDLTPAAAHAIGFSGLAPVTLSVVGHGGHSSS